MRLPVRTNSFPQTFVSASGHDLCAREHLLFIPAHRLVKCVAFADRAGKISCVGHGEVHPLARERRHQVRRVTQERHARVKLPAMSPQAA